MPESIELSLGQLGEVLALVDHRLERVGFFLRLDENMSDLTLFRLRKGLEVVCVVRGDVFIGHFELGGQRREELVGELLEADVLEDMLLGQSRFVSSSS